MAKSNTKRKSKSGSLNLSLLAARRRRKKDTLMTVDEAADFFSDLESEASFTGDDSWHALVAGEMLETSA